MSDPRTTGVLLVNLGTPDAPETPEQITFGGGQMSEEELLAGIEGLVPPEKSDD